MLKQIVVIGYGAIAKKHIEVMKFLGCEIIASCNRSEDSNSLAQKESHIPITFTDYHEMIKVIKPDGILVCVSFWNIFKVIKDIIPYKIPILCEKPSATSLNEHLELCALADKYQTSVMVGLNRRHYSIFSKAIDEIGGYDKITTVLCEWSEEPDKHIATRNYTKKELEKLTFANTIHGLDLMCFFAGKIIDLNFRMHNINKENYHWGYNVSGVSERGVLYNFNCSWDSPVPWRVVIYSKDVRMEFAPLETAVVTRGKKKHILEPDDIDKEFKAGFIKQAKLFVEQKVIGYELSSCTDTMWIVEEITKQLQRNF